MSYLDYSICKNSFIEKKETVSKKYLGDDEYEDYDVSICIPTFNRPDMLKEAINSCVNQKRNELKVEIIVVDNNTSPDNENQKAIASLNNSRIKYYQNEENLGIFGNWNRCFELAKGRWVSLLHDDDLLKDDCFYKWQKLLKKVSKKKNVAYIKANTKSFEGDSSNIKKDNYKEKVMNLYSAKTYKVKMFDFALTGTPGLYGMPTAGTLMNRQAILAVGGYNNDFFPSEDAFMPVRLKTNGYTVLRTISQFGYYRYSVNESQKPEIHTAWIKDFVGFQEYLKHMGSFCGKYVRFFEDEQLFVFTNEFVMTFVKDKEMFMKEIEKIKKENSKKYKIVLYKIIRRIHYLMFYIRALV